MLGRDALRNLQVLLAPRHLAPGGCVGQAIGEAEFGAQQLVHGSHDVGDDRPWGVELATTHFVNRVVLLGKSLVEMDDRVFLGVAIPEVADDGLHVGIVEQLHDLGDTQLVEVDARPPRLAMPTADLEEGLH
ncbi:MAG: hypothetical protein FJ290_32360 [Planctomycetes bacterium]|nr:hypothetical protein [Planctomycetota bacterium]